MRYYNDCSELPIYNFYKVLKDQEYGYLIQGYEGGDYQKSDKIDDVWQKIYEEYLKLTKDNKSLLFLETYKEYTYLKIRYQVGLILLQQLPTIKDREEQLEFIKELGQWNYKIDTTKPLEDEILKVYRQLKFTMNTLKMKEAELEGLKSKDKETMSLIEQTVKLEQALGRNEIDTKRTSVAKYIALINEVKLINQARRKHGK